MEHIEGQKVEVVTYVLFGGSEITAVVTAAVKSEDICFLSRKTMTNLDSVLESRDIALPIKVHIIKAMFFPVVMYSCESWTMKKAECQRVDAF